MASSNHLFKGWTLVKSERWKEIYIAINGDANTTLHKKNGACVLDNILKSIQTDGYNKKNGIFYTLKDAYTNTKLIDSKTAFIVIIYKVPGSLLENASIKLPTNNIQSVIGYSRYARCEDGILYNYHMTDEKLLQSQPPKVKK